MASDMCNRRLARELKAIQKSPMTDPNVYTTPLESNLLEWHYVIEGSKDTPYEGGFYWGKLIFPKQYPLKPPSVMMLTPNGRFRTGRRLCLSMSDYHPESWNPMWSVSTIITGLISFMVETAPTLGSIESSVGQKKKFAHHSLAFNVKDEQFQSLFPELVKKHEELMEERIKLLGESKVMKENEEFANMVPSEDKENEEVLLQGLLAIMAGFVALVSILFAMRFL
jgi:ubiquitin-conjugating enzyme E2 J2